MKGQWLSSKDGWETSSHEDRHNGFANSATWYGNKNPSKTSGQGMANSTTKEVGMDKLNEYNYVYTHNSNFIRKWF